MWWFLVSCAGPDAPQPRPTFSQPVDRADRVTLPPGTTVFVGPYPEFAPSPRAVSVGDTRVLVLNEGAGEVPGLEAEVALRLREHRRNGGDVLLTERATTRGLDELDPVLRAVVSRLRPGGRARIWPRPGDEVLQDLELVSVRPRGRDPSECDARGGSGARPRGPVRLAVRSLGRRGRGDGRHPAPGHRHPARRLQLERDPRRVQRAVGRGGRAGRGAGVHPPQRRRVRDAHHGLWRRRGGQRRVDRRPDARDPLARGDHVGRSGMAAALRRLRRPGRARTSRAGPLGRPGRSGRERAGRPRGRDRAPHHPPRRRRGRGARRRVHAARGLRRGRGVRRGHAGVVRSTPGGRLRSVVLPVRPAKGPPGGGGRRPLRPGPRAPRRSATGRRPARRSASRAVAGGASRGRRARRCGDLHHRRGRRSRRRPGPGPCRGLRPAVPRRGAGVDQQPRPRRADRPPGLGASTLRSDLVWDLREAPQPLVRADDRFGEPIDGLEARAAAPRRNNSGTDLFLGLPRVARADLTCTVLVRVSSDGSPEGAEFRGCPSAAGQPDAADRVRASVCAAAPDATSCKQ